MCGSTYSRAMAAAIVLIALSLAARAETVVEVGSEYVDPGANAYDSYDGDLTNGIVVHGAVNTSALGAYAVTYDVADTSGNQADQVVRVVRVVDTTRPAIALVGEARVTVELDAPYTDAGATAVDNYDGDLTARIVVTNEVDTATAGVYAVRYNVSDASGNAADEQTRLVEVLVPEGEDDLRIASPRDGSTLYLGAGTNSVPLTMTAAASVDLDQVEYTLDGVPFGMAAQAPYAVTTVLDLESAGFGEHVLAASGLRTDTGDTLTAYSTFTVAPSRSTDDVDGNGIPDNPFVALAQDGDGWLCTVEVPETVGLRTVALAHFDADEDDVPVVLLVENPEDVSRHVRVSVPRALVDDTEAAVVLVALSDDLESLLGPTEAGRLAPEPEGFTRVESGQYIAVSVIASTDGGSTFAEIAQDRMAQYPIHVEMAWLGSMQGDGQAIFAHPTVVGANSAGIQLAVLDGDWSDGAVQGMVVGEGSMSGDLCAPSVMAPYEQSDAGEVIGLIGDVNKDGVIEYFDGLLIKYIALWGEAGLNRYLAARRMALVDARLADVNLDGQVEVFDTTLVYCSLEYGLEAVNDYLAGQGMALCHMGEVLRE